MNKQEFLAALRSYLDGLPAEDIRRSLDFYAEMIDDYIEDGMTEEAAVDAVGDVAGIAEQIRSDAGAAPREKAPKLKPWELAIILLGLPLWISLLIAAVIIALALVISAAAAVLSVFVGLWSVIVSLYAAAVALGIGSITAIIIPLLYLLPYGNTAGALLVLGGALVLTGITILLFVCLKPVTKGAAWLTKKCFCWIGSLFIRKEAAQ